MIQSFVIFIFEKTSSLEIREPLTVWVKYVISSTTRFSICTSFALDSPLELCYSTTVAFNTYQKAALIYRTDKSIVKDPDAQHCTVENLCSIACVKRKRSFRRVMLRLKTWLQPIRPLRSFVRYPSVQYRNEIYGSYNIYETMSGLWWYHIQIDFELTARRSIQCGQS